MSEQAPVPPEEQNSVVAIYDTNDAADAAVKALQGAGVDMGKLSILGKGWHSEDHPVGFYSTGKEVKHLSKWGALWGGFFGFLFPGLFFIPGPGWLTVAGWLTAELGATLVGAGLGAGAGALAAALASIGIPKDSVVQYETAIKADKFLVIVHGTQAEVQKAQQVLGTTGATQLDEHMAA